MPTYEHTYIHTYVRKSTGRRDGRGTCWVRPAVAGARGGSVDGGRVGSRAPDPFGRRGTRGLWGCHLASLPCPLAEPPLCRQLRWVAGRGPRPSPPYATDPAFTPAAREGEVGLKTCTVTYTYTSNAHAHMYTDDDDSVYFLYKS